MKIGIISLNMYTSMLNFACSIHSYAFQAFLKQEGFDSIIIDYKPHYFGDFNMKYPYLHYKKHPMEDAQEQKDLEHRWLRLFFKRITRYNKIQNFYKKYYIKTEQCYTDDDLDVVDLGFDCYLCVTDVIWKYNKGVGFDRGFFLDCASMKGKYKVAYAASQGPQPYDEEQEKQFLAYIKDFNYISVREKTYKEYIESVTDREIAHVVDPVLLHEREFYDAMMIRPRRKKKYVLVYYVMAKRMALIQLAVEYAKQHDLEVIELSEYPENEHQPEGTHHKVIYDIGVEEWLGYIDEAECIFTNSFHATCFSILFHKPFFVGKRKGDKIGSLLEMFGLQDRTVANSFKKNKCIAKDIDYVAVDQLRKKYKQESAEYIVSALKDIETQIQLEVK